MKRIKREGAGVSNVISSIMLLAITLSLVGTIMEIYLPAWGKDTESRHLEDTVTQFYNLRSLLEEQIVLGVSGSFSSMRFSMGSPGGSLFGTGRVWGSLVINTEKGFCNVTNGNGSVTYGRGGGMAIYKADNGYNPDYTLSLEQGAIVLDNGYSTVLKAPPDAVLKDVLAEGGGFKRDFIVNLVTIEGNTSSYGSSSSALIEIRSTNALRSTYDFESNTVIVFNMNLPIRALQTFSKYLNDDLISRGFTNSDFNITTRSGVGVDEGLLTLTIQNVEHLVMNVLIIEINVYT